MAWSCSGSRFLFVFSFPSPPYFGVFFPLLFLALQLQQRLFASVKLEDINNFLGVIEATDQLVGRLGEVLNFFLETLRFYALPVVSRTAAKSIYLVRLSRLLLLLLSLLFVVVLLSSSCSESRSSIFLSVYLHGYVHLSVYMYACQCMYTDRRLQV